MTNAIVCDRLRKTFGDPTDRVGLNECSFEVPVGTVCGLLGPNGAGKSTAIRVLSTLLRPDVGRAEVAGFDVVTASAQVRRRIGLVGQSASVDEVLTGRQNLVMFGQLYGFTARQAKSRATELLQDYDLVESADRSVGTYSGGMRRRLDLAASLIVAPPVLFVDEPTTGLDPSSRRSVWASLRQLAAGGTTILLTTQYLEEADELADRIVMIRGGEVVASGTPAALKASAGGDVVRFTLRAPGEIDRGVGAMAALGPGSVSVDRESLTLTVPVVDGTKGLIDVATALRGAAIQPVDLELRRPSLDEVFFQLVGDHPAPPEPLA